MSDIHGTARWPGVESCEWCSYTIGHGIAPATAAMRINAQAMLPAEFGDLVFDDGQTTIVIPDCKVDGIKSVTNDSGTFWTLEIVDRRWKWRDLGEINGCYNQLDGVGKLIPWTIRSPTELAELCLEAMGEEDYELDLPEGLSQAQGANIVRTLRPGENFPPSGTNPPINWDGTPPAAALQQIADLFGRRVVYQISSDSVAVVIPGQGIDLPPGSVCRRQPSINAPERPTGVAVRGDPTRFQVRLPLQAVGKEWDGSYRPIDQLSYAPLAGATAQVTAISLINYTSEAETPVEELSIFITATVDQRTRIFRFDYAPAATDDTDAILLAFASLMAADPDFSAFATATVTVVSGQPALLLACVQAGVSFATQLSTTPFPVVFLSNDIQLAEGPAASWRYSRPPLFAGVRTTPNLPNLNDVRKLAQESVWRCYRIMDGPIDVPLYGKVNLRQQLLLQDTQVQQITPQPLDPQLKDKQGQPFTLNLYNGLSRDMPAAVYGAATSFAPYAFFGMSQPNTPQGRQYLAAFHVDAVEQLVVFSSYVYYQGSLGPGQLPTPEGCPLYDPGTMPGGFFLQTAVLVRDNKTNQFVCYEREMKLENGGDNTNYAVRKCPDVQLNVIGLYKGMTTVLLGAQLLEDDAILRAQYNLDALTLQYPISESLTQEYNGLVEIDLDGAVSQVSWEVGEGGVSTTASRNEEHSIWVPPYPARRRAEKLPAPLVQRVDMAKDGPVSPGLALGN